MEMALKGGAGGRGVKISVGEQVLNNQNDIVPSLHYIPFTELRFEILRQNFCW